MKFIVVIENSMSIIKAMIKRTSESGSAFCKKKIQIIQLNTRYKELFEHIILCYRLNFVT